MFFSEARRAPAATPILVDLARGRKKLTLNGGRLVKVPKDDQDVLKTAPTLQDILPRLVAYVHRKEGKEKAQQFREEVWPEWSRERKCSFAAGFLRNHPP